MRDNAVGEDMGLNPRRTDHPRIKSNKTSGVVYAWEHATYCGKAILLSRRVGEGLGTAFTGARVLEHAALQKNTGN